MADDANPANPATPPANTTPAIASEPNGESEDVDVELKAINAAVTALGPLKEEQRLRALEYIFRRFNAPLLQPLPTATSASVIPANPSLPPHHVVQPQGLGAEAIKDIRTLKESKAPKSAIQMAVLVAYYVSELAPASERKNEITKHDIERYFKSGGFKLPPEASATLINAKNAGYLDSSGAGQYKLNPVGYNLVAHRLGVGNADEKSGGRNRKAADKRRPRQAKKAARTKK